MPVETLFLFFLTDLLFCLAPGPATMVTAAHALGGGMRGALGPIAGVNIGNFIWYALVALGLVALMEAAPGLYAGLRWAGVAVLLWMGWRKIAASARGMNAGQARRGGFLSGFASGLAVHMSNPKAMIFFVAILPQFIDPARDIGVQILLLALVTIFTETTGLSLYAFLAAGASRLAVGAERVLFLNRLAGFVLIAVALVMAALNAQPYLSSRVQAPADIESAAL